MYQLSHLLIEQSNILSTLHEQNSTNVEDVKGVLLENTKEGEHNVYLTHIRTMLYFLYKIDDEAQNKAALAAIQKSLIGFSGNLENKTFLHEGALIELDPESYRPICRVYFFLLNDLLIVGKVKHDKYV